MLEAMRRVRQLLLFACVVVGSLVALGQGLQHGPDGRTAGPRVSAKGFAALGGPFESPAACQQLLRKRRALGARGATRGPRVGTWNLRWFPRGTHNGKNQDLHTDIAWLACAIALLDVDVLAVQEVLDNPEARAAGLDLTSRLDQMTGGRFQLDLDECPGSGRQHVGLLWNAARVSLREPGPIAALNPSGAACGLSLRPGFGAHARFIDGSDLHVISVHLDSGETERDFEHRKTSCKALGPLDSQLRARDPDVLVLGDYNTMGCASCEPVISADDELRAFDATLQSFGLRRLEQALGNRCSHYYRGRAALLDLAVASDSLRPRIASVRAAGVCEALRCEPPKRGARPLAWKTLSDHCPVVIELKPNAPQAVR